MQNGALRLFIGVGTYTPNAAVNGDTGWESIFQKQWHSISNQWYRIRNMDQFRLNYKIYQFSVHYGNYRHKYLALRVKQILQDNDISNLFEMHATNISKRYVKDKINEYIKTQQIGEW